MHVRARVLRSSRRSLPGEMDETDALRSKRCNDDAVSLAPSTTESIIVEGELARGRGPDCSLPAELISAFREFVRDSENRG